MFIYLNHIKNWQEDFKAWFKDLLNLNIPKWIVSPFGVELESINWKTFLKEFIETTFDIEAKAIYTFKGIGREV